MEERGREILDTDPPWFRSELENGVPMVVYHSRGLGRAPLSVVLVTVLYCAEFVSAARVSAINQRTGDDIMTIFTVTFMLVPAILTQLALTFIHRDVGRDRPLVLLLHLLLLGPVIRSVGPLLNWKVKVIPTVCGFYFMHSQGWVIDLT